MFRSIAAGGDVDAAVDKYMAEDLIEHENLIEHEDLKGVDNTRDTPR